LESWQNLNYKKGSPAPEAGIKESVGNKSAMKKAPAEVAPEQGEEKKKVYDKQKRPDRKKKEIKIPEVLIDI